MRKEAKLLRQNAVDSLLLAVEHFNRPSDRGRIAAVLIFLDHAFEQLLKAAICHRGGKLRRPRERQTIGFDECVRKALTDGALRFISEDQALLLQALNGLRDAAHHHLVHISEPLLYLHAQAGVSLFRDLLRDVFREELTAHLPGRVLPLSSTPPADLVMLFDRETEEIKKLLRPGTRKRIEAMARLRALAIVEGAVGGQRVQPSQGELNRLAKELACGESSETVFPSISSLSIAADGAGPTLSLRLTKKEGVPVRLVDQGMEGAYVIGVKRVNELDFYSLGLQELAEKLGLSTPKALAVVRAMKIQNDPEFFKVIRIKSAEFNRYSAKGLDAIKRALPTISIEQAWRDHGPRRVPKKK
jgi:hypothetical protein